MLQVVSLWASNLTRGPWAAMEQLQQSGCASSADAAVRAHVNALQPMLLAMMDQVEAAADLGREALARVPTGQHFADSVLCNAMAHLMGVLGEREQAQRLLDAARRGQQAHALHSHGFNRMYTESVEGLLDLQQGRLRQATARFRLALGMAAAPGAAAGTGRGTVARTGRQRGWRSLAAHPRQCLGRCAVCRRGLRGPPAGPGRAPAAMSTCHWRAMSACPTT